MVNESLELVGVMEVAGARGYSAYEVAVNNGYTGTEEEWLESLKGEIGPEGPQGIQGPEGPIGPVPQVRAGTVTKLNPEDNPYVNVIGTPEIPILNFGIPQGEKGDPGTTQYNDLNGKPTLNGYTLNGAVTLNDIGAQPAGEYVTPTDYANNSTGGVIKTSDSESTDTLNGVLRGKVKNYTDYGVGNDTMFICKGTLENVIAGKELTNKTYVDNLIGDISNAIDGINGEVI